MKRKYYMRGLGLGIIFTCVLFMIGIALGNPMSDEAVRRRARQLGMVDAATASGDADSRTLKQIQQEEEKKDNTSSDSSSTSTSVTTDPKTGQKTTTTTTKKKLSPGEKADDGKAEDDKEKAADAKEKTATNESDSKVTVSISSGDTSNDVGQKLQSAGVVDSGSDFNHFLEQHGYDRTIHAGTYSFKKGSSYSSIAGKISG